MPRAKPSSARVPGHGDALGLLRVRQAGPPADAVVDQPETLDFLSEGIYRTTLDGRLIYANRALIAMNGYDTLDAMKAAVSDVAAQWYVNPDRRSEFLGAVLRNGHVRDFVSEVRRHKTGERMWVCEDARLVRDPVTGEPACFEGSIRDVTALVRGQTTERQFETLVRKVPGGLFQLARHAGGQFELLFASPGFRTLMDLDPDDDLTDVLRDMNSIHPDDRPAYLHSMKNSGEGLTEWNTEFRVITAAGREKWLTVAATPELREDSVVWSGYCSDITERKAHELEIHRLAFFDPLTGLANRRHLKDRLKTSIATNAANGAWCGLISIDIDRFKAINDAHGHEAGDRMLAEIGNRLKAITWVVDLVARIDGDEFVVLCEGMGTDEEAARVRLEAIAVKLQGALRQPIRFDNIEHLMTASLGVVAFDGSEGDVQELLRRVGAALDKAKRRGGNTCLFFDAETSRRGGRTYSLVRDMSVAMDDGSLSFHLQPQLDRHGAVHGCEALMHWTHPRHGTVRPAEFFPLIENAPTMTLFTQWAVTRAIACLKQWRSDPVLGRLTYALNITPHSLTQQLAFAQLCETIRANRAVAGKLVLEITEHVLAQDKALVQANMQTLRRLGVQFSIDDFGTGFSSLAYLKNLTFDELKVDGSFIVDMERSRSDQALVRTILAVAQTLNMRAVAERVETEEQRALLSAYGCTLMQGFLFRPAMPRPEFEAYALDHPPPEGGTGHSMHGWLDPA